jgi:hypothetical protein
LIEIGKDEQMNIFEIFIRHSKHCLEVGILQGKMETGKNSKNKNTTSQT